MKVALFIPCYIDQLYPQVGMACLELLERLGLKVDVPSEAACCGQPMLNSGCQPEAESLARRFVETFSGYDRVIVPSGSCASMVRNHYAEFIGTLPEGQSVMSSVRELSEFIHDDLGPDVIDAEFPHRVGLHQSCHGLRELRLGPSSERIHVDLASRPRALLERVRGLELVELERPDECCGFGGTFAIQEESVSCAMGRDRIRDHDKAGAEVITSVDSSCLMHLDGLMRRDGTKIRVRHIAEILLGR